MSNIKNISPVTEQKSGSVDVKATARKTPKEVKRDLALAAFLIEIRNNPLLLTGCTASPAKPETKPNTNPSPAPSPSPTPQTEFENFAELPVDSSILTPEATNASSSLQPYSLWHVYNYGILGWDKNDFLRININSKNGDLYVSKIEKDASVTELSEANLTYDFSKDKLQTDPSADNIFIRDGYVPYSFKNLDCAMIEIIVDTNGKLYSAVSKKTDDYHKWTVTPYKAVPIQDTPNYKEVQSLTKKKIAKTYKTQDASQSIVIIKEGKSKNSGKKLFLAVDPDSAAIFAGVKDEKGTITTLYKYSK